MHKTLTNDSPKSNSNQANTHKVSLPKEKKIMAVKQVGTEKIQKTE